MKKQIISGALSLAAILAINANALAQGNTGTAHVAITLADVISVDPGQGSGTTTTEGGGNVSFAYPTEADYRSTKAIPEPGHLKITSTKAFDVNVKAASPTFVGEGTAAGFSIPVSVLQIAATNTATFGGTAATITALTTSNQPLVTASPIGAVKTLDVTYSIPQVKSESTDILGKPAGLYKQDVVYTVTAH